MTNNPTTNPLRQTPTSSYRPSAMNWRERGVGITRIVFGLVWVVAAILQWLPQFQNSFITQVSAAKAGQPGSDALLMIRGHEELSDEEDQSWLVHTSAFSDTSTCGHAPRRPHCLRRGPARPEQLADPGVISRQRSATLECQRERPSGAR
jgi:hypothetical protein